MSFYGVDAIEDAVDRTKDIILPFDLMTWTRLAVIIIFLGGTGISSIFFNFPFTGFSNYETSDSYGSTQAPFESAFSAQTVSPPEATLPAIGIGMGLAVIGALILSILMFMYLNSLAQFVMFRGIRDREIRIRRNIRNHYDDAAKYLLFQLVVVALAGVLGVGWLGSFAVNPIAGLLLTLAVIPIGILLAIFTGVVHDFVLQKIIDENMMFIESLKRVFDTVTDEWRQLGAYLIARLFISYAVALMLLIVIGVVSIAFLLVFGILAGLFALLSPILATIPTFIGFVLWAVTMLYITVPFRTYMYSYFVEAYEKFPFNS